MGVVMFYHLTRSSVEVTLLMLLAAVSVAEVLRQISRSEAEMLTTGSGLTVMVTDPVEVQP